MAVSAGLSINGFTLEYIKYIPLQHCNTLQWLVTYSIALCKQRIRHLARSWEIPGKIPKTHQSNYLLYYQLINAHHITSKVLIGIKISHTVSLQIT